MQDLTVSDILEFYSLEMLGNGGYRELIKDLIEFGLSKDNAKKTIEKHFKLK